MGQPFGIRTTHLDENTSLITLTPDFITQVKRRMKNREFKMVLQKLPEPTEQGYSHRIYFDYQKFIPEDAA